MIKYCIDWQKTGFSEDISIGTKLEWSSGMDKLLYEILCHDPPIIKCLGNYGRYKNKLFLFSNNYWKEFSEQDIIDGEEIKL